MGVYFVALICNSSKAQINFDGLWGLSTPKKPYPEMFIRFNKDTFEFTNYTLGIEYGRGTWKWGEKNVLILKYDSIPYQRSFVSAFCDSPHGKAERLMLTVFVYDGFSQKAAYKPTITFYDSGHNEILDIEADTSGKVTTTLYHPSQFKKVRVNIARGAYDDSPEFDLTGYGGKNLYLQFYINLSENSYKKKSTETYDFRRSGMGDIILKDHSGHEFIFSEYGWRYGL